MKKMYSLSAVAVFVAMTMSPVPQAVHASTGIQRCAMADGSTGYSDRACGAYGAESAPIPDGMMTRLLATMPEETTLDGATSRSSTALPSSFARREARAGCARSIAQLEADVRGSFMLGDVNRIAESFYWVGLSNAQGQRVMDRLQTLAKRPIRDTHMFSAQIASLSTSGPQPNIDASTGTLQLLFSGPSVTALDLDVEKYAGCYFVRF